MFENIINFIKKIVKKDEKSQSSNSKDAAKERLHLVLMQDRANVSVDFLELMKQEIIEVIKKYIEIDEKEIDVRLTNKENEDGTNGAPALYANIPILNIKNEARKIENKQEEKENVVKEKSNDETQKQNEENNQKEKDTEEIKEVKVEKESDSNKQEDKNEDNKKDNEENKEKAEDNKENKKDENKKDDKVESKK